MPRRRRLGRVDVGDGGGLDWMPDFSDDLGIFGAIILAIFVVIAAIFVALVLFNVIAIAIELLLVIVLFVFGVVSRVVFRRPWTVFAASKDQTITRSIVGWRASKREIEDLSARLQSGLEPAPGDRR